MGHSGPLPVNDLKDKPVRGRREIPQMQMVEDLDGDFLVHHEVTRNLHFSFGDFNPPATFDDTGG